MKCLVSLFLVALVSIGLSGCLDLNDNDNDENHWIGFGLVVMNDLDGSYIFKLDDGEVLYPVNDIQTDLEDNQRVIVNFVIEEEKLVNDEVEEYYVKVYSIKDVLYKGILDITPEIEDSIGSDAINVDEVWQTDSMLTFELKYYGAGLTHYINLVKDPGELTADSQPVQLELRHNDNNDSPLYKMSAYVTFDLGAIKIEGQDSTSYVVTSEEYGGETFIHEGVYFY